METPPWKWRQISFWGQSHRTRMRQTRQFRHIVPSLADVAPLLFYEGIRMEFWSKFYLSGLELLPFLFERSGYSEEFIHFLH
jgi:hypothetical protein